MNESNGSIYSEEELKALAVKVQHNLHQYYSASEPEAQLTTVVDSINRWTRKCSSKEQAKEIIVMRLNEYRARVGMLHSWVEENKESTIPAAIAFCREHIERVADANTREKITAMSNNMENYIFKLANGGIRKPARFIEMFIQMHENFHNLIEQNSKALNSGSPSISLSTARGEDLYLILHKITSTLNNLVVRSTASPSLGISGLIADGTMADALQNLWSEIEELWRKSQQQGGQQQQPCHQQQQEQQQPSMNDEDRKAHIRIKTIMNLLQRYLLHQEQQLKQHSLGTSHLDVLAPAATGGLPLELLYSAVVDLKAAEWRRLERLYEFSGEQQSEQAGSSAISTTTADSSSGHVISPGPANEEVKRVEVEGVPLTTNTTATATTAVVKDNRKSTKKRNSDYAARLLQNLRKKSKKATDVMFSNQLSQQCPPSESETQTERSDVTKLNEQSELMRQRQQQGSQFFAALVLRQDLEQDAAVPARRLAAYKAHTAAYYTALDSC